MRSKKRHFKTKFQFSFIKIYKNKFDHNSSMCGKTWGYITLTRNRHTNVEYSNPNQTRYSIVQWHPRVLNTNTNLSKIDSVNKPVLFFLYFPFWALETFIAILRERFRLGLEARGVSLILISQIFSHIKKIRIDPEVNSRIRLMKVIHFKSYLWIGCEFSNRADWIVDTVFLSKEIIVT